MKKLNPCQSYLSELNFSFSLNYCLILALGIILWICLAVNFNKNLDHIRDYFSNSYCFLNKKQD